MNKSLLMTQYKELYGGFYIRNNGRWYWKATTESEPTGPISGFWLRQKIQEAKNQPVKTIEFVKLPTEPVVKEEVKEVVQEKPVVKKSSSKKPAAKKPVEQKTEVTVTEEETEEEIS